MLYFSELRGKKVYTESMKPLGHLSDLSFMVSDTPRITNLIVQDTKAKKTLVISTASIKNINHKVVVSNKFEVNEIGEQELLLNRNLLDKQIIDIQGNKVVRVNDIAINDKMGYYVAGADIGMLGVLRWLKIEDPISRVLTFFGIKLTSKFLSWGDIQPLELARGMVILKTEQDKLKKIRPEDLADYLEKMNIVNVDRILGSLDEEFAADVINSLNINYQTVLFRNFDTAKAAHIISLIDPDEAVDILLTLTEHKRNEIIETLPIENKKEVTHLLSLSQTPIGEKLTTEYLTVFPDDTVREVIDKIKKTTSDYSFLHYIYVTNKEDKLIGVVSIHEILLQSADTRIYKFMMPNVVVIHLSTPEEIAISKMLKYKVHALPVIDKEQHMLGIVVIDDMSEVILDKLK